MGLYERLLGSEQPKLPVHQFAAALNEVKRSKLAAAGVKAAFALSPAEQAEFDTLQNRIALMLLDPTEVHDVLMLAEWGVFYPTVADVQTRLGV